MKAFKQAIALALAFCMLVQPLAVSASEIEPKAADEITTNEPLAASASEIEPKAADEITANEPLAASASEIEPKAADEITTNEPLAVPASEVEPKAADEITTNEPLAVPASEVESKPADGTTIGEPFSKGTAGSSSFRIPSLVTLSDGTLVAAADARWNTTYDGGGLDTIVSRSSDDGANWNYTFANYLGDNGNEYNGSDSTCFLDPAMAVTSDDTIYMLVDLYPYGVALNGEGHTTPTTAKGFDGQGHLLLSNDNHSSYGYYLENGKIYSSDGTEQTGYTVDDHFNVTEPNGTTTNLFFKDSTFKVVRTGFLYLTKSTNKGETWSAPTLLNLKTTSEQVCLVGPGRGLVTSSGMIVFPCYSFHGDNQPSGNTQRLSFIYSTDGTNWNRTSEFNYNWASEAAVVELADGKLRFFFRNGTTNLCYVDYNVTSNAWGSVVNTGLDTNSNCQISAITYSKTVDGKQVIFVSCPTGKNENGSNESSASARLNGKIFVGLVNEDANKTMSWQQDSTVGVNSNNAYFMYSCLAELKDGKVAILYEDHENAWGAGYKDGKECYYTMEFDTFELNGLEFDAESSENEDVTLNDEVTNVEVTAPGLKKVDISADDVVVENDKVSKTYHITLNDGAYTNEAIVKIPYDTGFDGCDTFTGFVSNEDGTRDEFEVEIKEGYFVCTVPHFSDLTIEGTTNQTQDITLNVGETFTVTDTSGNYEDFYTGNGLDTSKATVTVKGETVAGGTEEAVATTLIDGTEYYIKNESGKYLAYNNNQISWVDSRDNATLWKASSNKLYSGNRGLRVSYNNYLTTSTTYYKITAWTFSGEKLIEGTYTLGTPYVLSTTNPVDTTEITFKGVSVGKTSVKVGNVTYLITVNQNEVSSSIAVGNTATFSNAGTIIKSNTNSSVATATLNNGILTVNALKEGTTIITTDNCIYTITVNDGTPITIKEKETEELSVDLEDGQYVEWTTADSSYVGVAGKYDATAKKYTDKGVIIGHNVTDTPVVVTGTIYNSDGTKVGIQKWLVTVIKGDADTNTSQKHIYVNVTAIENCTVYYAVNGGELVKINGAGVLVNETINGHYNIMFFADPDEGYALTYMSVSGSDKQYYTLSDGNPDGTGSGAWPFDSNTQATIPTNSDDSAWVTGHGFRWSLLQGNMTIEQMKLMFSTAIALGCDGATNFTKNGDEGFSTNVQFAAQKLPDLEKEIDSITRENGRIETYVEGMKVAVGDIINYKIYIHEYAGSYGTITYSNESLNDPLTGTKWSPDLESSSATASVHSFDTKIELTKNNFNTVVKNGKITNTADLVYDYKSEYSTGTLNASASAVAEITVDIPSYVIDFGLPVTFNLSELTTVHGTIKDASATYGDVSVRGANVTYTPKTTLKDVDYIELELESGHYAIAVYPATTVYYEEGFVKGISGDWENIPKNTLLRQAAEEVGSEGNNVYGYDGAYIETSVGASNGSSATAEKSDSSEPASIAEFTFTGTGVDIYTNNTPDSGVLMAWVKNSAGNTVKAIQVDTHMANGSGSYTTGQNVTAYNVPVISLTGLERGSYTVELRHIGQSVKSEDGKTSVVYKPVSLDGYRVHGTLDPATMAYQMDGEAGPKFFELRNSVLAGLKVNVDESEYAKDIAKNTLAQVYAKAEGTAGAVVLSSYAGDTETSVQDLLDNGPKNELYLRAGEAVVFKVLVGYQVQVGMKALNAAVSYSLNGSSEKVDLQTSTDMFYVVDGVVNTDGTQTITITNNSGGILSITEIKMLTQATASEVAFMSLEEEDLIPALMTLGYRAESAEPEVTYADATLNIVLNDATGKAFAATTLTANGVLGETNIFSAATIEEAVAALVPEGYELKGVAYADQEVTYGEEATVTFAVEDNQPKYADAKLIVKLTDKKGNVVAEKALTANGLVGKTHTFKSNDIEKIVKDILPNGYKLRNVRYKDQKVVYGEELTVTFTAEGNKQEHADAKLIVKLTDKKGNVIAENTMTANGVTGKTHTFKSNDIKKIVKDILPKNYKLKNTRYSNQKVAYGKSVTITFTVENNKNSNRR